jgi:microcystin-dependent protein
VSLIPGVVAAQLPFVGEVMTFAGFYCPEGYLSADGRLLSIQDEGNTNLFDVIGTTFGGDGQSTFALPNLLGAAVVGTGQGPGRPDVVIGQTGGTTNTVGAETAVAKAEDVPKTQSPSLAVMRCVSLVGAPPQ